MLDLKKILLVVSLLCSSFIPSVTGQDTIVVGYTEGPPFVYGDVAELSGISVWLWEEIAQDLELEFRYEKMDFNDILKGIREDEVDVCINSLTVTSDRLDFMDFSFPFFSSNSAIVIKKEGFWFRVKHFFRPLISIEFIGAFSFLIFIIFLFGFLVWLVERHSDNTHFRKGFRGIWDGVWWSSVTVTTVGYGDKTPSTRVGKIFALMWMFIALIFISSLTAGLTSNFTESRLSVNNSSFESFKTESVGTVENSGTHQFLKDHFFQDLHLFPDLNSGLKALKTKEIDVFSYDEPNVVFRINSSKEYEDFKILPLKFDEQFYAFGFAAGQDSLIHEINKRTVRLMETKDWEVLLAEYKLGDSRK